MYNDPIHKAARPKWNWPLWSDTGVFTSSLSSPIFCNLFRIYFTCSIPSRHSGIIAAIIGNNVHIYLGVLVACISMAFTLILLFCGTSYKYTCSKKTNLEFSASLKLLLDLYFQLTTIPRQGAMFNIWCLRSPQNAKYRGVAGRFGGKITYSFFLD